MKMFKKLSALLIAAVMVLAMAVPAMAQPKAADTGVIAVTGVEDGAVVKAVRIVEPTYVPAGLSGYKFVDKYADAAKEAGFDMEEPSAATVAKLFALIDKKDFTIELTKQSNGKYEAEVAGGVYLVYIVGATTEDGKANIYNPLVVALAYDPEKAGSDTELVSGEYVFHTSNEAAAKYTTTDAGKKFTNEDKQDDHADTVKIGDRINWELYADVPTWNSDAYKTLQFRLTDTMEAGKFKKVEDYVVKDAAGNVLGEEAYTLTPATDDNLTFVVDFKEAWLRDANNQGQRITVTYSAELTEACSTGFDPNTNKFKLEYSHNPKADYDEDLEEIEEITKNYTLDISFIKVDEEGNTLEGAGFALYADEACTQEVRPEVISGKDGMFAFKGLDEGTYYMKETTIPAGFTATDLVYTITITAEVEDKDEIRVEGKKTIKEHSAILKSYKVSVTNGQGAPGEITKENGETIDLSQDYVDQICNTKIPVLPSTGGMGTYIFTIAGVAILAVAASMLVFRRRKEQ